MTRAIKGYDDLGNEVWRESTPAEDTNLAALVVKASAALAANATFLAIASPTNTQLVAQAKALTRQVDALIRFQLSSLSDVSDT